MKIRNLFFTAFAFMTIPATAGNVTSAEALRVAAAFFCGTAATRSVSVQLHEVMNSNQLGYAAAKSVSPETPAFYVFAPEQGDGFVIVAGDDASAPILAYSFSDPAPAAETVPCNLRWWMEAQDNRIKTMRKEGVTASASVRQQWISRRAGETEVLLETAEWGQGTPYNLQCPTDGGSRCVTGCSSTATAIVMRYFRCPEKGNGNSEGYYTDTKNIRVESRNLEHAYDWDNMPLEDISSDYTSSQAEAVSALMADLGACFKADYQSTETPSSISMSALHEHFGYSEGMIFEYADAYGPDEWTLRLMDEIASTGPVLYQGNSDTAGHAFVLDGYTNDGYFHINWGWCGSSDGYFLLPEIDYAYRQSAYFGVKPDDGTPAECVLKMLSPGMSLDTDEVSRNVYFNIAESYALNVSLVDFTGYVCFALTDGDGNVKEWISKESHYTSALSPNYYYTYKNILCLITTDIGENDRIREYYKDSEEGQWKPVLPQTSDAVWEIVIGEDVAKGEDGPEVPECILQMYSPGMSLDTEEVLQNVSFNIAKAYALNVSFDDWYGYVCFALTDGEGNVKEWISKEKHSSSGLSYNHYRTYTDVPCLVTVEISSGDRIRMFYKDSEEGNWKLMAPRTDDAVWEIVVSPEEIPAGIDDIDYTASSHRGTDAVYDLSGRKVKTPVKGGVYIVGGKKVLY